MSNYETTINISDFKGLMQYGEGYNTDMRYAVEAQNAETMGGVLQPAAACTLLAPTLPNPIETLARLYRRWYSGIDDKEILIAASGGKLYYLSGDDWEELPMPDGIESYQSNEWSWVTYEINPEGSLASVDVLLMSNAYDGMIMVRGDNMTVSIVPTPKKFGTIERSAERIWGGAIINDPDMLVYSAPYDPTDWEANVEIPEDGAGDLLQPSWDGDSFTALRSFGSQLIAFKKTRAWRILGTNPGEYTFKEQFGGGAQYPGTVAVDLERIYMLTDKGPQVYDGLSAVPYMQDYCSDIWERLCNLDNARAASWHHKLYFAVCLDGNDTNNAVVVYDTKENTWMLRTDACVEQFLATEDTLYFTSPTTPGRIWKWAEDSWHNETISAAPTIWVSPWTDLGAKNVQKGGFDVYFVCDVQRKPVTLKFTMQTEKKKKSKNFTAMPVPQSSASKTKQKKMHFGGTGRRFRIMIEGPANAYPWRLTSGLQIVAETDPD